MRRLSSVILFVILALGVYSQSPHGAQLSIPCADCHNPNGWKLVAGTFSFNHSSTKFPLVGQHEEIDCKMCHTSLVFSKADPLCMSCHEDMHFQSVGFECGRCHTPYSWIVNNITEVHQRSRFPLVGAHFTAECIQCHPSASLLNFEPLGVECIDCHEADYLATTSPNHVEGGYSTNCYECHSMNAFSWTGTNINHSFFPLTEGHAIDDCNKCHTNGDFSNTSPECFSCHQSDFNSTTNPNHIAIDFSTVCTNCHTTAPGWKPADYKEHDVIFPIYSGKHNNEWNNCVDCHTNQNDYTQFTCTDCHDHNQQDMDNEHDDVGGYLYNSLACFECHPRGDAEDVFNHNTSNFPLTGAHTEVDCASCHTNGYSGTSTICSDCHIADYNQSVNPNHLEINLLTVCEECHTTAPDWKPAAFTIHNDYYPLTGAHTNPDCFACHQDNYNNTPNQCVGCHLPDYNQTTNPPHESSQFGTDCESCHTNIAWTPATFDHDGQFFPIYSGKHNGEWTSCTECHTTPGNYAMFSCIDCHEHNKPDTDDEHNGVGGYLYESQACFECHPTGDGEGGFNHNTSDFPLTGAHLTVDCISCHENGYSGTSTICADCHTVDYNQTSNPNHLLIGISNECLICHTTAPEWKPALFPVHNEYYEIAGAHIAIANDCFTCHNGDYNNTPNLCFGCHATDYNQTNDPNHEIAQFPTDCETCHSQNAWEPSTFNHDGLYFPIYSGKHDGEWDQCSDCHNNPGNYEIFTCITCHQQGETDDEHDGVGGYAYNSDACYSCHPDGTSNGFNHNATDFPLTGAHTTVDCILCHENGYFGTSTICFDCHDNNYIESTNPNHTVIGIPNECVTCHTTNPGWSPATFPIHNNYYELTGGHATISEDCIACHEGDYNNTPTICFTCHTNNYNQTSNPNHMVLNIPTECADCHTTNPDWNPATFSIHNNYYFLDGAHTDADCFSCHDGDYNNTSSVCFDCHTDNYNESTNPNHVQLSIPTECADCHTTNPDWNPATFDIHNNYYVLDGAHTDADCFSCHNGDYNNTSSVCFDCHTDDYNQSTNPNHVVLDIPNECADCHTTNPDWNPATFDIHNNYYVLDGAHLAIECVTCHDGDYNNTSAGCFDCHSDDYNQSTNPNHVALGIPNVCADCHTTNADWNPATFDIHDNYYVLAGAHIAIANDCSTCHNGDYNNTPNTCYGCHQTDYNQTTDPPHQTAQFPIECELCHTQNAWVPSTFNHDGQYFPIYSGEHNGEWDQCSDCHNNPSDYSIFTCLTCHSQSETNNEHEDVSGYQYNSNACYACHPNGDSGGDKMRMKKIFSQ